MHDSAFWDRVRASVIGSDVVLETCFGPRRVLYADYTASGRAVAFIEDYVRALLACYANTHTEDDATGRATTERLHQAERLIKRLLNAGRDYAVIAVGAGTTGAVERLQQILGVYVAPASRDRMRRSFESALGAARGRGAARADAAPASPSSSSGRTSTTPTSCRGAKPRPRSWRSSSTTTGSSTSRTSRRRSPTRDTRTASASAPFPRGPT